MKFLLNLCLIAAAPSLAFAQANQEGAEQAKPKKKFERVNVLGSRIRRTDMEGPAPVIIIDRKAIEDSPYNSVGDFLRELPSNSFGSRRESTGSTVSNSSSVNLRGLGATNTLVLLNGSRLQPNGRSGEADLNLIPEIAIEGSEILKDGASAIYGADAIGGVVLLNTRKDFTGVEGSVKYVQPEQTGGEKFDLGVIGGKQFKKGSVTAAVQYRKNNILMARDRDWTKAVKSNPNNGFSNLGPVPSYLANDGGFKLRPEEQAACTGPNQVFVTENDGVRDSQFCRFAFANFASELPEIEQYSAYANTIYQPDTRTTIDTTVLYSNQMTHGIFAPVPQAIDVLPGAVAGWGIPPIGDIATDTDDGTNTFRVRHFEAGNRIFDFESEAFNVTTNVKREFLETWESQTVLGFGYTDTHSQTTSGALNKARLEELYSTNPSPYNPYNQNAAALESARAVPFQDTSTTNYTIDTSVTGELMELKNGLPLSAAFGLQYNHMSYSDRADAASNANEIVGGASSGGAGNRDILSVYTEVVTPLTKKLELQTAARFDWFSDFGTAFSPMGAIKYVPNRKLLFRSSVGKAFKAPLLQDLYAGGANGFPFFIDHVKCNENPSPDNPLCSPQQYLNLQDVNRDLDPEEAITYNAGVVFEPIFGLSITTDIWHVNMSNVIGINLEQVTLAEANGGTLPSAIDIRRRDNGQIRSITTPNLNLSKRKQTGLDVQVAYKFKTSFGKFTVSDEHSQMLEYKQNSFAGLPTVDLLDDFGIPRWRNTARIVYEPKRGQAVSLSYTSIAGQKTANRFGRIKTYGELDLSYLAALPWRGQINVGVKNLAKTSVPFDRFLGYDSSLYQPLGRYAFVNYRQSF